MNEKRERPCLGCGFNCGTVYCNDCVDAIRAYAGCVITGLMANPGTASLADGVLARQAFDAGAAMPAEQKRRFG